MHVPKTVQKMLYMLKVSELRSIIIIKLVSKMNSYKASSLTNLLTKDLIRMCPTAKSQDACIPE